MIKINLATKKSPSAMATSGAGAAGGGITRMTQVRVNVDDLKELPLLRIVLVAVIYFLGNYLLDSHKESRLAAVAAQIQQITMQENKLKAEIEKNKGFDQEKVRLEKDELVLKTKIKTIEKLMAGRKDSIKVLFLISQLLPGQVWIKDLTIKEQEIKILGRALDYPDVNEFMKRIGESAFFTELNSGSQKKFMDTENKIELVDFDFSAKRRPAVTQD